MSEQGAQKQTQILLIGHYPLLRESLGHSLATEPDFKVAAQCATVAEALETLNSGPADVVLLDVDFGDGQFKQLTRALTKQNSKTKVLLLAAGIDRYDAADLIGAGISGVFQKEDSVALLGHAIRDVAAGNLWFQQEVLKKALNCRETTGSKRSSGGLTHRESRVLSLVSEGLKNKDIGAHIGVSESSVKAAIQKIVFQVGRSHSQPTGASRPGAAQTTGLASRPNSYQAC